MEFSHSIHLLSQESFVKAIGKGIAAAPLSGFSFDLRPQPELARHLQTVAGLPSDPNVSSPFAQLPGLSTIFLEKQTAVMVQVHVLSACCVCNYSQSGQSGL